MRSVTDVCDDVADMSYARFVRPEDRLRSTSEPRGQHPVVRPNYAGVPGPRIRAISNDPQHRGEGVQAVNGTWHYSSLPSPNRNRNFSQPTSLATRSLNVLARCVNLAPRASEHQTAGKYLATHRLHWRGAIRITSHALFHPAPNNRMDSKRGEGAEVAGPKERAREHNTGRLLHFC